MGNTPSNTSPPVRSPMKIHQIHGKNLTISPERLQAKRHEGYSDGLFFGSRPACHGEQLEITVMKIINEWNGALRFGFTTHNPIAINSHPEGIPRYMCPDLIKRGGSYVETISQISLRVKDKIVFWLEPTGEVNLKVNEVMQKCQLHGIFKDVWPVVDVYGNTVEVAFRSLGDNIDHINPPLESRIYSSLRLSAMPLAVNAESVDLNIDMVSRSNQRKAYAWNAIPLQINTVWALFVNAVDHSVGKDLAVAVLKTAPQLSNLPEQMKDFSRGLGWLFDKAYTRLLEGDEFAVCILDNGVVLVAINGEKFEELGKVSPNPFYWLAVDLNCSVTSLTSIGVYKMTRYALPLLPVIANISEAVDVPRGAAAAGGDARQSAKPPRAAQPAEETARPPMPPTPTPVAEPPQREKKSGAECVICLDSVPDNVFIPCGHVCCCKACADNLMNEHGNVLCPACRKVIEHSYKVFL